MSGGPVFSLCSGVVAAIEERRPEREIVLVRTADGHRRRAIHYPGWFGPLRTGQTVWLNVEAVRLGLGAGGFAVVVWAERHAGAEETVKETAKGGTEAADQAGGKDAGVEAGEADAAARAEGAEAGMGTGEAGGAEAAVGPEARRGPAAGLEREAIVVKERYTPLQFAVPAAEFGVPPGRLAGRPVLILPLHSALPLAVRWLRRRRPGWRIAFVMTDAAALPGWVSDHLAALYAEGALQAIITAGNAFGGTHEAINRYGGLLVAAREAEAILIGPGPGGVGVGHPVANAGAEQAENINAVAALGGIPVLVPRLSAADPRPRHRGLSHHTRTALALAFGSAHLVLPAPAGRRERHSGASASLWAVGPVRAAVDAVQAAWAALPPAVRRRHRAVFRPLPSPAALDAFDPGGTVRTMGRDRRADPLYYAGVYLSTEYYINLMQNRAPAQSTLP
ncbi:hypothetical protein SA87_04825 [Hydrogenibacillus schlegelii]|uniref:DUF3866 domain-containing protein n=1 Tax=Hydrogenibacillus schlegelii TaxID=1484 RepID=A0A179IKM5_HYDSH|nr:hypothetical protein SA87_04825 [Hydrogenibacillus schlegelii]